MTQEEYRAVAYEVIYLIRCVLEGRRAEDERLASLDLDRIYTVSSQHMLVAAVGMALADAGVIDERFVQATAKAQRKIALMESDRAALTARLEEAGIWYLPLKGSVLATIYPRYGMRQMSDVDILIDPERTSEVRTIMEDLGFTTHEFGGPNHDVYFKLPVSNFEIHKSLFTRRNKRSVYEYYMDVEGRLKKDADNHYGRHFTPEDFYLYLIAHEHKHFAYSGTGLRSLLDTYVYLTGVELDRDYVAAELEVLELADFEAQNRSLAVRLFSGEGLSEADEELLDVYLSSGTYGNSDRRVINEVKGFGGGALGRVRYLLSRLFPDMARLESIYPFFYRHKVLLPALFIYRVGRGLTISRKKVMRELTMLTRRDE